MSVDRAWLEQVRKANRAKVGLAGGSGLGGLGASAADSILARFTGSAPASVPAGSAPGGASTGVTPRQVASTPSSSADDVVSRALRAAAWIVGGSVALLGVAGVVAAVRGRRAPPAQANPRRRRRRRGR